MCRDVATELGLDLTFLQSSHEGQIVDWFHELGPLVKSGESIEADYNPARTRNWYAVRDATEGHQGLYDVSKLSESDVAMVNQGRSVPDSTASAARLLRGGTILTSDPAVPDLLCGDLLIRDGRIDAVGEDLGVGPDVEIVDRTGTVIFPGPGGRPPACVGGAVPA